MLRKTFVALLTAVALASCGKAPELSPKAKHFKLVGTMGDRSYHIGPTNDKSGPEIRIWIMNNLSKPAKADVIYDADKTYQSVLKLVEFICSGKEHGTIRVLRYYLYEDRDLRGWLQYDSSSISSEGERVDSDDISQAIFREACRRHEAYHKNTSLKGQTLGQQLEKIYFF